MSHPVGSAGARRARHGAPWSRTRPYAASRAGLATRDTPVPIGDVSMHAAVARPTGLPELDRVLDGGLVPGSVTLLAGEPGMGKSTLLLQALGRMAEPGARCLLVTAEESSAQVRMRAERLGALAPNLLVVSETSLPHVVAHVESVQPDVLALDSIQTVLDPDLPGAPGSVTQVRDCAYRLVQQAKERELATVLVGHVTKEGTLAGPRVLEHVVDTVLAFDGDRGHALRMLHALKHRFGSTHELGLFEMTEHGLDDVPDASSRFLVDRRAGAPGSAVAVVLEGTRPLLVEVQALVVPDCLPPRRSAAGIDPARLAMVLAVLDQHGGVSTAKAEVYASVAGGLRVTETRRRPRARARGWKRAPEAAGGCGHGRGRGDRLGRGDARRGAARPSARRSGAPRFYSRARAAVRTAAPRLAGRPGARRLRSVGARPRVAFSRVPAQSRTEAMMYALRLVAPGTALREGLDRILQARMGALIVIGDGPDVLSVCSGGFLLDSEFTPQRLSELAKMDGAIILASDGSRGRAERTSISCPTRTSRRRRPVPGTAPPNVWDASSMPR